MASGRVSWEIHLVTCSHLLQYTKHRHEMAEQFIGSTWPEPLHWSLAANLATSKLYWLYNGKVNVLFLQTSVYKKLWAGYSIFKYIFLKEESRKSSNMGCFNWKIVGTLGTSVCGLINQSKNIKWSSMKFGEHYHGTQRMNPTSLVIPWLFFYHYHEVDSIVFFCYAFTAFRQTVITFSAMRSEFSFVFASWPNEYLRI